MGKICEQFEAEMPTRYKAHFEVLDLMQQLQDLDHPPKRAGWEMPPGHQVLMVKVSDHMRHNSFLPESQPWGISGVASHWELS